VRAVRLPRRRAGIAGAVLVAVLAAVALPSCGGGSSDGYEVTASFSRAVALYEGADVLVMGIDVGDVTAIEIAGAGIDVTMSIDEGVPLPDDATAAIVPSSLIGERTVVLGPAWRDGADVLVDGDRIPVERTIIPVEPDEALESVTELLQSLDPESVRRLLAEGSGALEGNGRTLNQALGELGQLIPYLADQDDELLAIAGDVNVLADVIRARDTEVGQLLTDFAAVSGALAEERESLARFLTSLTSLTLQGEDLLAAYETSLPEDMDTLAAVALTVNANAGSVRQLLLSLREFQLGVIDAYDPSNNSVRARVYTSQTLLNPIMEILLELGLVPPEGGPIPVPTIPVPTIPVPTIPTPTIPVPTIPTPTIPPPTVPDPGDGDGGLCVPLVDPGCDG
jgi:phospholipid/cholesterol/gamma-HCH transport system substrate-binding protein